MITDSKCFQSTKKCYCCRNNFLLNQTAIGIISGSFTQNTSELEPSFQPAYLNDNVIKEIYFCLNCWKSIAGIEYTFENPNDSNYKE